MLSRRAVINQLALFIAFSALVLTPVSAQDELPTPIDPQEVFVWPELVEVVETLPLYFADQEQVSFYDYQTEEWHSYPYPQFSVWEGEVATPGFTENADGSYSLNIEYHVPCGDDCEVYGTDYVDFTPPRAAVVRERWHFDRRAGEFRPFDAICGEHAQALPGEGQWVVTSSDSGPYVCNTETGQASTSLDGVTTGAIPALLNAPSVSPDGRRLVFTFYFSLDVHAYDFENETLTYLGTMTTTSPFFGREYPETTWITDERIVLENATANYGDDHSYLYRADVSEANSLELFYHSNRRVPLRLDNPLRFVWIGRAFDDLPQSEAPPPPEEDCTINEYYPEDGTIKSYLLPGICDYGWTIPDGREDRLTLVYPYEDDGEQNLVRFNPETSLREEIPVGDYQGLAGFSPDGRYAVLTVDTGQYDYQIAVLDLNTKSLLEPLHPANSQVIYIQWIGNRTFRRNLPSERRVDELYTISGTNVLAQTGKFYPPGGGTSPDDRFLLVESNHGTLDIWDIETLEPTAIAQIPDGAVIYAVWQDNGLIEVSVWEEDFYRGRRGRWRIRLNI